MSKTFDVIIIGSGITGINAALQAARSGLSTAILEASFYGGLVLNINHLDGAISGSGMDLATDLLSEARDHGAQNISATATAIRAGTDGLVVESDSGNHQARAVIIASGARLKRLGIPGEADFEERGVSRCADCDGPLYQNQDVMVVGGGDSALQEALVLAEFARQVHLVHRGAKFSARSHLVDRVAGCANISIHFRTQAEAITGTQTVQSVRVRNIDDGTQKDIACAGFFGYIGLEPACEFAPATVQRDAAGFLVTDTALQTAMTGLFAAGAVRSGYGGMLADATAEGIAAANSAMALLRG
jgi:thioredoxin reductase (NADPH)